MRFANGRFKLWLTPSATHLSFTTASYSWGRHRSHSEMYEGLSRDRYLRRSRQGGEEQTGERKRRLNLFCHAEYGRAEEHFPFARSRTRPGQAGFSRRAPRAGVRIFRRSIHSLRYDNPQECGAKERFLRGYQNNTLTSRKARGNSGDSSLPAWVGCE